MCRTFFRILAAALLALAVPVQGLAAVNAGLCMAMGGHGGEQSHAAAAHHHEGAAHDHGQAPSEDHHSGNAHCPPCVSCCAAAAIASATNVALPEAPPGVTIAAPHCWIAGILPEKLDRPPVAL